jgi:serine/threonine protein kinase
MSRSAADRNLLFGILAVQMDFIRSDQLIGAMNAWVIDKQRPLGDHLAAAGALAADSRQLLDALVDKHIALHGGRAEASLAALSSVEPLRHDLAAIVDGDVQTSLAHAPTPRGDRHATVVQPARTPAAPAQRFRVLRPHAAGGLGKVSVARDDELHRDVALKELHDRHADHPDSRARFLQEAEITGGLEHPGVVPIYGLGQYADGRPFYAMRFIRGDSLAQAIDRFHRDADPSWRRAADVLQLRRLLSRFLDVCNAIEYAHSRGVLHRDLKPGNIMLGQYGETLVVDWGLAKAQGQVDLPRESVDPAVTAPHLAEPLLRPESGSGTAPTQMGAAVGTPAFMSPEQATGRLDQLSGASDVFSLGATLYVILTGRAPQDDGDLGVVLQRVARGEFPRPRDVKPAVPRALEAICLKAMALHPRDRYASPRQLADDVEAWLADEPVTALREAFPMRTARWVKKHRTLVTSGVAMTLVAAAALAAGNVSLRAANDRERDAKVAALSAQKKAESAQRQAERAQAEAERQIARNEQLLALARRSLERYESLSKSELLATYGMESLRGDLLEAAIEFYDALAAQTDQSETARADRGEALFRLGGAYWQLGRMDEAQRAYQQAIEQFRRLQEDFPDNAGYQQGAAVNAMQLAEILINNHSPQEAAPLLAAAAPALDRLRRQFPDNAEIAARRAYASTLEGERRRQLGEMDAAAVEFARAIDVLSAIDLAKATPEQSVDVRYRLARAQKQLAVFDLEVLWKFPQAGERIKQASQLMRDLFREEPENLDIGHTLAQTLRQAGDVEAREFRLEGARAAYQEAFDVASALDRQTPDVPHLRQELADLHSALGGLHGPLESVNFAPEALTHLEEAAAIGRELAQQFPQQLQRQLALARYESALADAYRHRGRDADARSAIDNARVSLKQVADNAGEDYDILYSLAELQIQFANLQRETGRPRESLDALTQTTATLAKLVRLAPNVGDVVLTEANFYLSRSMTLFDLHLVSDAIADFTSINAAIERCGELADAPWMKGSVRSMVVLSHTARLVALNAARNEGTLELLADEGQYRLCGEQARKFPLVTGVASDHYVAAQALAYAAALAAGDDQLAAEERLPLAESLSAEAVRELEAAWRQGYLRPSKPGGIASLLFGSARSPSDLREDDYFDSLQSREDFSQLLARIEQGDPPPPESTPPQQPPPTSEVSPP